VLYTFEKNESSEDELRPFLAFEKNSESKIIETLRHGDPNNVPIAMKTVSDMELAVSADMLEKFKGLHQDPEFQERTNVTLSSYFCPALMVDFVRSRWHGIPWSVRKRRYVPAVGSY